MRTSSTLFSFPVVATLLTLVACGGNDTPIANASDDELASFCDGWLPVLITTTAGDRLECGSGFVIDAHSGFTEEQCVATLTSLREGSCEATLDDFKQCDDDATDDACAAYVLEESEACNRIWTCDDPRVLD